MSKTMRKEPARTWASYIHDNREGLSTGCRNRVRSEGCNQGFHIVIPLRISSTSPPIGEPKFKADLVALLLFLISETRNLFTAFDLHKVSAASQMLRKLSQAQPHADRGVALDSEILL
jgi:hypothetical protein